MFLSSVIGSTSMSRDALIDECLFHSLEEGGQTALGPALLVSISIASRVPGSKVRVASNVCVRCHVIVIVLYGIKRSRVNQHC